MSSALEDLRRRWAEEAVKRSEPAVARALEDVNLAGEGVAPPGAAAGLDAALTRLHREPDDDQPWRRSA